MQSVLLRAVRASGSSAVYVYAWQHLGEGVPPTSTFANLIKEARSIVAAELFVSHTQVVRKGPLPRNQPHNLIVAKRSGGEAVQKQVIAVTPRLDMLLENYNHRQQKRKLLEWFWRDQTQKQQLLEKLVREQWQETQEELRLRLVDEQPLMRLIAVQVIAQRRLPLAVDLIDLLTDPSVEVREAARQALARLSRGCDFGPTPQATAAQCHQATAAWRRWLALQDATAPSPGDGSKTVVSQNVFAGLILR